MTNKELLELAAKAAGIEKHELRGDEIERLKAQKDSEPCGHESCDCRSYCKKKIKEPEQEPVAMKFKIYKPTVQDPLSQDINNALLPWVYDQDRSSGFDASMWVTPVSTLPPQRKPLTDEQRLDVITKFEKHRMKWDDISILIDMVEAAHGIKE